MARTNRGWTNVDVNLTISSDGDVDPLGVLKGITKGMRKLDGALRDAVVSARGRGHSWEEIGDALGVTRQTAWERFGSGVEPEDPIAAARGALADRFTMTTDEMRELGRQEDAEIEERRSGGL